MGDAGQALGGGRQRRRRPSGLQRALSVMGGRHEPILGRRAVADVRGRFVAPWVLWGPPRHCSCRLGPLQREHMRDN